MPAVSGSQAVHAGAGVDVQLLEDGELLVSRRCVTAEAARYVAQSFENDH
jgi:hypothetical protein